MPNTLLNAFPCPLYFSMLDRILISSLTVILRTTVADNRASSSNYWQGRKTCFFFYVIDAPANTVETVPTKQLRQV
jgi:hypothetical protein